jgi:hypothetical protein
VSAVAILPFGRFVRILRVFSTTELVPTEKSLTVTVAGKFGKVLNDFQSTE